MQLRNRTYRNFTTTIKYKADPDDSKFTIIDSQEYNINIFACDLFAPRQIKTYEYSCANVIYVGSRKFKTNSSVYALVDYDKDGYADEKIVIEENLNQPNGVEIVDDCLYVATAFELIRYCDIQTIICESGTYRSANYINKQVLNKKCISLSKITSMALFKAIR